MHFLAVWVPIHPPPLLTPIVAVAEVVLVVSSAVVMVRFEYTKYYYSSTFTSIPFLGLFSARRAQTPRTTRSGYCVEGVLGSLLKPLV